MAESHEVLTRVTNLSLDWVSLLHERVDNCAPHLLSVSECTWTLVNTAPAVCCRFWVHNCTLLVAVLVTVCTARDRRMQMVCSVRCNSVRGTPEEVVCIAVAAREDVAVDLMLDCLEGSPGDDLLHYTTGEDDDHFQLLPIHRHHGQRMQRVTPGQSTRTAGGRERES